jgi:hypothetical protein
MKLSIPVLAAFVATTNAAYCYREFVENGFAFRYHAGATGVSNIAGVWRGIGLPALGVHRRLNM